MTTSGCSRLVLCDIGRRARGNSRNPGFRSFQARAALGVRSRQLAGLDVNALAAPPGAGGGRQAQQLGAWNTYLAWERSYYQRLEHAAYSSRVVRRGEDVSGMTQVLRKG